MLPKHRENAFSLSIIFTSSLQEVTDVFCATQDERGTRKLVVTSCVCVSHACDMQNTQKSIMNKCFCCLSVERDSVA